MGIAVVLYECTPWEYEILQKKASYLAFFSLLSDFPSLVILPKFW